MTDYRALCAELHTAVQLYTGQNPAAAETPANELVARLMAALAATAAALAQPEPEGPTEKQVMDLADDCAFDRQEISGFDGGRTFHGHGWECTDAQLVTFATALITRYARPAIEPVPVSERLPEPEDCDAEGRCWWEFEGSDDYEPCWALRKMHGIPFDSTHWLPCHALPLPTPTP